VVAEVLVVVGPKSISDSSEDDLAGALVVQVGADVCYNGCDTANLLEK
jgi:dihydroorotate dehydrogenase